MSAGLEIYNQAGVLQISQDNKNFHLRQKGSVACNTAWTSGGLTKYTATITYAGGTAPMIAIATDDGTALGRACVYEQTLSGSTWTFKVVCLNAGQVVDYWIFDAGIAPAVTVGLEVFNAAGELAYHTELGPLRIAGAVGDTLAAGRDYAVIQSTSAWTITEALIGGGNTRHQARLPGVRVSGDAVSVSGMLVESYTFPGSPGPGYTPPESVKLVADITYL